MAHSFGACNNVLAVSGSQIGCHETHGGASRLDVYFVGHVAQCPQYHVGVIAVGEIIRHIRTTGKGIDYQCPVADTLGCRQFDLRLKIIRSFQYILH